MKLPITILFLTFLLFVSCQPQPKEVYEPTETQKVVTNKTIEVIDGSALDRGYTKYLLAFNDGHTERVNFGEYSCVEVGDTVTFIIHQTAYGPYSSIKIACE